MILEIYDYLWIRNTLITKDLEKLIEDIDSQESFIHIVKCISGLLQTEDFPLVFPQSQEKISTIIQTYRFIYNEKNIVEDISYIIERLNEYKTMSEKRKGHLIKQFYVSEFADRDLPFTYMLSEQVIEALIINDIYTYNDMFCLESQEAKAVVIGIEDIVSYSALINLIMNRYPDFFDDENYFTKTTDNLTQSATIKGLPHNLTGYLKKTVRKLNTNDEKRKRLNY